MWNYANVWESIAAVIPERPAQIQGERVVTWAQFDARADALARRLMAIGLTRQSKVAAYLYNGPEYLETYYAAFKGAFAPVNTNYRYVADELIYLFDNADAEAIVFHAAFTPSGRGDPRTPAAGEGLDRRGRAGLAGPGLRRGLRGYRLASRPSRGARLGPLERRPLDPLHRRHDRHAERRDVAPGGPVLRAGRRRQLLRRHRAAGTARGRRRPGAGDDRPGGSDAGPTDHPGRRAADARHGPVHRPRGPDQRRRRRLAAIGQPLRRRRTVGRGRTSEGGRSRHRGHGLRPAYAGGARRQSWPLGPLAAAPHRLVRRNVEHRRTRRGC